MLVVGKESDRRCPHSVLCIVLTTLCTQHAVVRDVQQCAVYRM